MRTKRLVKRAIKALHTICSNNLNKLVYIATQRQIDKQIDTWDIYKIKIVQSTINKVKVPQELYWEKMYVYNSNTKTTKKRKKKLSKNKTDK